MEQFCKFSIPRAFSRVCLRNGTIVSPFKTGVRKKSGAVLTEENIKKYLKVVFSQADKDKDGQVSSENVKEVFKMFLTSQGKPENPLLYKLFDEFVFNDKPTLSLEELEKRVNSITAYAFSVVEYMIKEKFSRVDENKDGKLNKEEASKLLEELHPFSGKEKVDQLMTKHDKDKDGLISYEELLEYVKNYVFVVEI